jgi:hypothetical protein
MLTILCNCISRTEFPDGTSSIILEPVESLTSVEDPMLQKAIFKAFKLEADLKDEYVEGKQYYITITKA